MFIIIIIIIIIISIIIIINNSYWLQPGTGLETGLETGYGEFSRVLPSSLEFSRVLPVNCRARGCPVFL